MTRRPHAEWCASLRDAATADDWRAHAPMSCNCRNVSGRTRPRKPRIGRPPLPPGERLDAAVLVKLTTADRERFMDAAEARGVTLADVARKAWERLAK